MNFFRSITANSIVRNHLCNRSNKIRSKTLRRQISPTAQRPSSNRVPAIHNRIVERRARRRWSFEIRSVGIRDRRSSTYPRQCRQKSPAKQNTPLSGPPSANAAPANASHPVRLHDPRPLARPRRGFEAAFALYTNVERIGRDLQVFHERDGEGWEHVAVEFGRRFPGGGPDPLFARLFITAVVAGCR